MGLNCLGNSISQINSIESYRQCDSNIINAIIYLILIGIEGNTSASKEVRSRAMRWYGCTGLNELDAQIDTFQGILTGIWIGGVHPKSTRIASSIPPKIKGGFLMVLHR